MDFYFFMQICMPFLPMHVLTTTAYALMTLYLHKPVMPCQHFPSHRVIAALQIADIDQHDRGLGTCLLERGFAVRLNDGQYQLRFCTPLYGDCPLFFSIIST